MSDEDDSSFEDGGFGGESTNVDGGGRQGGGSFGEYVGEQGSHSAAGVTGSFGGGGDYGGDGGGASWLPAAAVIDGGVLGAAGLYIGYEEMKRRREERERYWQSRYGEFESKRWDRNTWGHRGEGAEASTTAGYFPGYSTGGYPGGADGVRVGGMGGSERGPAYVGMDEALNRYRRGRLRDGHHEDVVVDGSEATWGSHPPLVPSHHPNSGGPCRGFCCLFGLLTMLVVFVSLTIFRGIYGTTKCEMGMHESRLFTSLPLYTDEIEVVNHGPRGSGTGVIVYGLTKEPKLKRAKPWHADYREILVRPNDYRSWAFQLHRDSKVVADYSLEGGPGITFVILRGVEALHAWLRSPIHYDEFEYRSFLRGKGRAPDLGEGPFVAPGDDDYYFVLGNLKQEPIKMNISFVVESFVYDLPRYKDHDGDDDDDDDDNDYHMTRCDLRKHGRCSVHMPLFSRRYVVVATPDTFMGASVWHITIEYGARWITIFVSIGVVLATLFFIVLYVKNSESQHPHLESPPLQYNYQSVPGQGTDGGLHPSGMTSHGSGPWNPIRPPPSLGPAPPAGYAPCQYPDLPVPLPEAPSGAAAGGSIAFPMPPFLYQDSAHPNASGDYLPHGYAAEGEATGKEDLAPSAPLMANEPWNNDKGENDTISKPLISRPENPCVVCFDAPKDAIFNPCGHRATCHGCAVRLQQSKSAQCPICRAQIIQVIKVFDT